MNYHRVTDIYCYVCAVSVSDQSPISILTGVVIALVILGLAAAVFLYLIIRYKKRNATGE